MSMLVEPIVSILVGEAILNITSLLVRLPEIRHRKRKQIAKLNRWKTTLEDLRGYLIDAEDKKQSNPVVRAWLEELEDLMYDMEDAIELFNFQVLQRQVEAAEPGSSLLSKIGNRLVWRNSKLNGKFKEITERFQHLKDRKGDFNLLMLPVPSSTMLQPSRETRDPSGPHQTEPVIFGRDDYKRELIQILKDEGQARIGVVPIVGMGGLGKTTLARYVYHDEDIKSHFDVSGWVCVSADYDTKRITKDILDSVSRDCGDIKDMALASIQTRLGEVLRNKKFLLVLDDNWNESYCDWQTLKAPFNEGLSGSKIIVTTRSKKVAMTVKTTDSWIEPNFLSENDCWSLFCFHANLDPNGTSVFQKAGKEIAKKCSGLPLATMIVGGMLRDKSRVEEWENIQNSMAWVSEDVMPALRMSYNDLTPQLKKCFAFLSLFPEDCEFKEDEVVLLWLGTGLILSLDGGKTKEEVARDFVHELLSRSLLSVWKYASADHKIVLQYYMMHDLVRELAQQVSSRKTLCVANDDRKLMRSRHLAYRSPFDLGDFYESIIEGGKVTVLPLRTVSFSFAGSLGSLQMDDMFLRLKHVRVLVLKRLDIEMLPESIGQMKLLRYLDLSGSTLQTLPTSLTTLYNLEILILYWCSHLKQLPERFDKLMHLWYLDCPDLEKLPEGIKELKRLEKLTHFIVDEKLSVASLGIWKLLRGSLRVSGLKNVASPEEATSAELSKKRLDELELNWSDTVTDDPEKMEKQSQILEKLEPHENLKSLKIRNYNGQIFPLWLKDITFGCLTELTLSCCFNYSTSFTPDNLVSLEVLRIAYCANMEVHLPWMPKLKALSLDHCSYVGCTDTFNAATLDALTLEALRMSDLFKEKVKLGCPNIRYLEISYLQSLSDVIAENYDEEIRVEELRVTGESSSEHLPQWVSKAKYLQVGECSSMKELLRNGDISSTLRVIGIRNCPQLTSILSQDPYPKTAVSLERIWVDNCSSLKVVLPAEEMTIENCISLESFLEGGPQSHPIKRLSVHNCPLLSQKLRDRDEQLCSKISVGARVEIDGERIRFT